MHIYLGRGGGGRRARARVASPKSKTKDKFSQISAQTWYVVIMIGYVSHIFEYLARISHESCLNVSALLGRSGLRTLTVQELCQQATSGRFNQPGQVCGGEARLNLTYRSSRPTASTWGPSRRDLCRKLTCYGNSSQHIRNGRHIPWWDWAAHWE